MKYSSIHISKVKLISALTQPDGVDDLNGDECAGDGAGAGEQPALRGQPDQLAGHHSQEQASSYMQAFTQSFSD